jgi:hypothetical protein
MVALLDTLTGSGIVTIDVDLTLGDWSDRSLYRNVVTANGAPTWVASKYGWGMNFTGSSNLSVPHSTYTSSPLGVAVLIAKAKGSTPAWRILCKRAAGGTDYELYHEGTSNLTWYNGTLVRGYPTVIRPIAVVLTPKNLSWWTNVASVTSTEDVSGSGYNTPLLIGNSFSGTVPYGIIHRVILFNKALTSTEAQTVLAELLAMRRPTRAFSYQRQCQIQQIGSPALHWPLDQRGPSGQYEDISGNGRHATTSRAVATPDGAAAFAGNDGSYVSGGNLAVNPDSHLVSFWVRTNVTKLPDSPHIFGAGFGADYTYSFQSGTTYSYWYSSASGSATRFAYQRAIRGLSHVVLKKTSSTTGELYVDGNLIPILNGSHGSPLFGPILVGKNVSNSYKLTGNISKIRAFSGVETSIRKLYLEGSRVTSDINIDAMPVSLAAITTVGSELPASCGIKLLSGQWAITAFRAGKEYHKAINCVAAGVLWSYDSGCRTRRRAINWASGTLQFGWASVKGSPVAAGQNGYWCRVDSGTLRITKSVAGTETTLASGGTIVAGTEYETHFQWETDGTLTLHYRALGSSQWLLACSAVDTTVTSTTYSCLYSSAANNKLTRRMANNEIAMMPNEWETR